MNMETIFVPQEVAYRLPTRSLDLGPWRRKIVKTERALEKLLESVSEKGGEFLVREAEVSR